MLNTTKAARRRHGSLPNVLLSASRINHLLLSLLFVAAMLLCAASATVAYSLYPLVNGDHEINSAVTVHALPDAMSIEQCAWASLIQSDRSYEWLVPTVYYLEEQGAAIVAAGKWKDAQPVYFETEKLKTATTRFDLTLTAEPGQSIRGYAYRSERISQSTQYIPLRVVSRSIDDSSAVVAVPECKQGDSFVFVLLVMSQSDLPADPLELKKSISLSVSSADGSRLDTRLSSSRSDLR